MTTSYFRDVGVLTTRLGAGRPTDSTDVAEGVIVHLFKHGRYLEIKILGASTVLAGKGVEVPLEALFPAA